MTLRFARMFLKLHDSWPLCRLVLQLNWQCLPVLLSHCVKLLPIGTGAGMYLQIFCLSPLYS